MSIRALTDRDAVIAALAEFDGLGRDAFLAKYGFGPATNYRIVHEGRFYDSKAIAGVAYGKQFPEEGYMHADEFAGGLNGALVPLQRLGFAILPIDGLPPLEVRRTYSHQELAEAFGFAAGRFQLAGGMVEVGSPKCLLIITHPGGGKTFDYEDRWEGRDLLYTGRGKLGDQKLSGPNKAVANNSKPLLLFEGGEANKLTYLGTVMCLSHWTQEAPDKEGKARQVYRFRLHPHDVEEARASGSKRSSVSSGHAPRLPAGRGRAFEPSRRPSNPIAGVSEGSTPEARAAALEKAVLGHHEILCGLCALLKSEGWRGIKEDPETYDLTAVTPKGTRWWFEAKTITAANELSQTRHGIAQLFEYRLLFGESEDQAALVTNRRISDRRIEVLNGLGIAVMLVEGQAATRVGGLW